jgi:Ni,Fe-hydrogenase III component G
MEVEKEIKEDLLKTFKEYVSNIKIPRAHRVLIDVKREKLKEVLLHLRDKYGITHIAAISAVDVNENIELLYHLSKDGVSITLRIHTPKKAPNVDTVTDILPGAVLYELEVQDMMGVVVKDHPDPRRLLLPEDWPDGVYPLRKDWKVDWVEGGEIKEE